MDSRFAFVNHSSDYRPNWTPLDLITIIYKTNLGKPGSVRVGRASIYEGLATLRRTIRANSALPQNLLRCMLSSPKGSRSAIQSAVTVVKQ